MMTLYMTPYRRSIHRHLATSDQIARNIGHIHADIHIPMDIADEKDAFVLYAALPGLTADDINIEIVNNTLDIRGEFKQAEEENVNYLRRERPAGTFRRSFRFSTKLDAAKAEAKLENGMLTLRLPKVEEALPKSIKVQAG
jgi:HSP20 family protein